MRKFRIIAISIFCISAGIFASEDVTRTLKENIKNITLNPFLRSEKMQELATIISNKGNTTDLSMRELYLNTNQQNSELENIIQHQKSDGSFSDINYNDKALSSWDPLNHISRLLYVARLYVRPGSAYYQRKDISEFLHKGLNAWYRLKPVCRNWWYNQIGVPKTFGVLALLLENELTEKEKSEAIVVLNNSGFRMTGQNKVWLAGNVLLKALLLNDLNLTKAARDTIASEIYKTTNEGIQPDFSFHQHGPQQQFGNYGLAYINSLAYYANVFRGTELRFNDSELKILRDFALEGEGWVTWHGYMDVSACNRQLFKKAQIGKVLSLCVALNLLRDADPDNAKQYDELILRNLKPETTTELTGVKHFWRSDLTIFRNNKSYISVRSCSPRVKGTELVNNENKKGQFISDGCTIFMRSGNEYNDIFPVWDWNKIPGVTAPVVDSVHTTYTDDYRNKNHFVGAVVSKNSGIATFHLHRNGVEAKKSWFYLNGVLVCLGNDIHSKTHPTLVTTVNQCLKNSEVSVQTYENSGKLNFNASDSVFSGRIKSVWHDSIAYYFPQKMQLNYSAKIQSGNWHLVADPYSKEKVLMPVFKLWMDHSGNSKQSNNYEYMVIPAVSQTGLNDFISNPTVDIVANNSTIQAVKSTDNSEMQFVFYKACKTTAFAVNEFIQTLNPGLVILKRENKRIAVSVSDPTQTLTEFRLKISGKYSAEGIQYTQKSNETTLYIALPQGAEAGKTVTIELN